MIIKSIELKNFRNYEELTLSLDRGTNIFYGDNAQGKTNILEAAYLSGTTKSHKFNVCGTFFYSPYVAYRYRLDPKKTKLVT